MKKYIVIINTSHNPIVREMTKDDIAELVKSMKTKYNHPSGMPEMMIIKGDVIKTFGQEFNTVMFPPEKKCGMLERLYG